jgi:hypothetical protein
MSTAGCFQRRENTVGTYHGTEGLIRCGRLRLQNLR